MLCGNSKNNHCVKKKDENPDRENFFVANGILEKSKSPTLYRLLLSHQNKFPRCGSP